MKKVIFAVGMKKLSLLLSVLLLAALTASAQEKQPSWLVKTVKSIFQSLTVPNKTFDSEYVYQTPLKWMVGVETDMIRVGAQLHNDFTVTDLLDEPPTIDRGTLDIGIRNEPYWKLGLSAAYGSLQLGYGIRLGNKDKKLGTFFSLGKTSSFYGGHIRYTKIQQYPEGKLKLDGQTTLLDFGSQGEMRNLSIDAFYAFNRHRFVFTSAYDGRVMQRRSSGSWLVSAKYHWGDFAMDPDDELWEQLGDRQRYSNNQLSTGGGYSFNWVPFHHDPADPSSASGLRNLTVNATALCRISFLNSIKTEQTTGNVTKKERYRGQVTLSPAFKGGVCYTMGRCNLLASIEYDRSSFQGADSEETDAHDYVRTRVSTKGAFFNLFLEAKVQVRF